MTHIITEPHPIFSYKEAITIRECINEIPPESFMEDSGAKQKISSSAGKSTNIPDLIWDKMNFYLSDEYKSYIIRTIKSPANPISEFYSEIYKINFIDEIDLDLKLDVDIYNQLKLLPESHRRTRLKWSTNPNKIVVDTKTFKSYLKKGILIVIPVFHISKMPHGSFIKPHTDNCRKLMSVMHYLPSPEQNNNTDLGTIFHYSNKVRMSTSLFSNGKINLDSDSIKYQELISNTTVFKTSYSFNVLVTFFRSPFSWHSFNYPEYDIGPRISININYFLPISPVFRIHNQ